MSTANQNASVHVETIHPASFVHFRQTGPYGSAENRDLMEDFKRWAKDAGHLDAASAVIAIVQDDPTKVAPELCRYDIGVLRAHHAEVEAPAMESTFAGGRYAVFELNHTEDAVHQFWQDVAVRLGSAGLVPRAAPMIERYALDMVNAHRCEILLPIE